MDRAGEDSVRLAGHRLILLLANSQLGHPGSTTGGQSGDIEVEEEVLSGRIHLISLGGLRTPTSR